MRKQQLPDLPPLRPFAVRVSDVDDLFLNSAGCMVCCGIHTLGCWIAKKLICS